MRWLAVLLGVCALLLGSSAWAAPESAPADDPGRQQAKTMAERGFALIQQKRYPEAIEHFRKAEELHHAPPHLWYQAYAHTKLGQMVQAHRLCVKVAVEPLGGAAPPPFHDAQLKARQALHRLQGEITGVRIVLSGVAASQVEVKVDGTSIPAAELAHPVALDPRPYVIEATAEGYEPLRRSVEVLAEPPPVTVQLALVRKPAALTPPPTSSADATGPAPATPPPSEGSFVPGAVALAVGGAGLVLGVITGALSLDQVSDIKPKCVNDVCLPDQEDEADGAKTLGHVSTVGLIAGGALAVAGVVLLIVQPGGSSEPEASASSVGLRAGPGQVELFGTF